MAEHKSEKKSDKKSDSDKKEKPPVGGTSDGNERLYQWSGEIVLIILAVIFLGRFLSQSESILGGRGYGSGSAGLDAFLNWLYYAFLSFALYFTIFSNILSVLFIMGTIYAVIRLTELNKAENERLHQASHHVERSEPGENPRWLGIIEHINSDNSNDWRVAIIEADVMLDDLLSKIGCTGATIAEKLQQVDKSDFVTIDNAWEAHKVRNTIAHDGQNFLLSKREAQRVIRLYETVFNEFHLI